VKVEVGLKFEITFLTQHLDLSIFYPNLGSNNPVLKLRTPIIFLPIKQTFCLPIFYVKNVQ